MVGQRSRSPGQKCFVGVLSLIELDGSMRLHCDEETSYEETSELEASQ